MTKIIATHLKPGFAKIIHLDQAGFLPQREARDNHKKVFNFIAIANRDQIPHFFLSKDAEKAFDSVRWEFTFQCLKYISMGPKVID